MRVLDTVSVQLQLKMISGICSSTLQDRFLGETHDMRLFFPFVRCFRRLQLEFLVAQASNSYLLGRCRCRALVCLDLVKSVRNVGLRGVLSIQQA
jgi:hypothetical protein